MSPIERLAQTDPYIAASLERVCSGRNVLDDFFHINCNCHKAESEDEPMTNQQKAAKAVHDLAVAGYGDELNAILAFLIEAPIGNLSQFSDMVDAEVAANPNLPEG